MQHSSSTKACFNPLMHVTRTGNINAWFFRTMVLNVGPPDVIELQLPEAFATTSAGQDLWELKSKNIWRPKVGDHCFRRWKV